MSRKKPYYHIKGQTDQLSVDIQPAEQAAIAWNEWIGGGDDDES